MPLFEETMGGSYLGHLNEFAELADTYQFARISPISNQSLRMLFCVGLLVKTKLHLGRDLFYESGWVELGVVG